MNGDWMFHHDPTDESWSEDLIEGILDANFQAPNNPGDLVAETKAEPQSSTTGSIYVSSDTEGYMTFNGNQWIKASSSGYPSNNVNWTSVKINQTPYNFNA